MGQSRPPSVQSCSTHVSASHGIFVPTVSGIDVLGTCDGAKGTDGEPGPKGNVAPRHAGRPVLGVDDLTGYKKPGRKSIYNPDLTEKINQV